MDCENCNEHKYDIGRFRLREESDHAIIDELGNILPIMIVSNTVDGLEPMYADRRTVLHILNELSDTNHDEHKFWYLRYRLNVVHNDNYVLRERNNRLENENKKLRTLNYVNKEAVRLNKIKTVKIGNENVDCSNIDWELLYELYHKMIDFYYDEVEE